VVRVPDFPRYSSAVRVAIVLALAGCAAPVAIGAAAVTGYAVGSAAMNRKAGGCIATCVGGLVCNSNTGLCEKPRERCDSSSDHAVCVSGTEPGDVAATAPGGTTIGVLPSLPPLTGDVTRIVPAAEQNPPSSK
jgi:hypothetical protein